jgi:hypothetical protein
MNYPNMLSDCKSSYFDSSVYDFFRSLMVAIVASPLLMPKAWQEAGYFFCLATKEVPERKRPDYGSRWRTRRRSAKSSELASLRQQRFLNASLLLPFAVEPEVDRSSLRNDAVARLRHAVMDQ